MRKLRKFLLNSLFRFFKVRIFSEVFFFSVVCLLALFGLWMVTWLFFEGVL